jgi:hypothetical protein
MNSLLCPLSTLSATTFLLSNSSLVLKLQEFKSEHYWLILFPLRRFALKKKNSEKTWKLVHAKTCHEVLQRLFRTSDNPNVHQQLNKTWHIYSIKRNELLIRATTWLKNRKLSEKGQSQKTTYCMTLCTWNAQKR